MSCQKALLFSTISATTYALVNTHQHESIWRLGQDFRLECTHVPREPRYSTLYQTHKRVCTRNAFKVYHSLKVTQSTFMNTALHDRLPQLSAFKPHCIYCLTPSEYKLNFSVFAVLLESVPEGQLQINRLSDGTSLQTVSSIKTVIKKVHNDTDTNKHKNKVTDVQYNRCMNCDT